MADKETALTVREANITDLKTVSQLFAESGYFPDTRSMAQAFVKIQAGREMGVPAMASMTGIAIIQGKPVVGANIIAAKVRMSGYDYRVRRLDNTGCSIEFFNANGESLGVSSFDEADAKAAGLTGKDNWKKYARNMYFSRAISNGQRWYCPDATQGQVIYTPDELGGKVNEDGEPVVNTRGKPVMDSLDSIIDKKNAIDKTRIVDAVVDTDTGEVGEPPAWVTAPEEKITPAQVADMFGVNETLTPEELVEESDEGMIFRWRDEIAKETGETPDAVMKRIATFTSKKDGKTTYTTTLKKMDGSPISEKWLKQIKHDMRVEHEKKCGDGLPF